MHDIRWLRSLCNTNEGPFLRPFAPNAQWNSASVIVVGTNPATPLREEFADFDDYWTALTRYPARFEKIYSSKHTAGASKSTLRARHFLNQLHPLNTLVTNALIYPAKRPHQIPDKKGQHQIGLQVFDFLLKTCRPKAILLHGSEAVGLGNRHFQIELDPYQPVAEQNMTVHVPPCVNMT